jgi:catechol 1,2-dioxygenase
MSTNKLDRRKFLKAGSMLGIGSLLLPRTLLAKPSEEGDCAPTTDDILGPYYLAGSPNTTQVALPGEPGTRLYLSGTVLSSDCITPVPSAKIEVWQANDAAEYDTSAAFNLRGTMYADENGLYAFETILPGAYLNGAQYRPKHIHYKVTKPGFPELITQLYFEGDPYIDADPWASLPDAAQRIIPLNPINVTDLEGTFDVVLDGITSIKPNRFGLDGDLMPVYPNPMSDRCSIHFNVFHQARVGVHVADLNGQVLVTLINEEKQQGRYTTQWDGRDASGAFVASGTYLLLFRMDGRSVKAQRVVKG